MFHLKVFSIVNKANNMNEFKENYKLFTKEILKPLENSQLVIMQMNNSLNVINVKLLFPKLIRSFPK